jgi:hypothetical protein
MYIDMDSYNLCTKNIDLGGMSFALKIVLMTSSHTKLAIIDLLLPKWGNTIAIDIYPTFIHVKWSS